MAKKAAAKPATAKAPSEKPAAAKSGKRASPAQPAAATPALTPDGVGLAAGDLWRALDDAGELSLAALKKATPAGADAALMALGWLAREGKLAFTPAGKSIKVRLR